MEYKVNFNSDGQYNITEEEQKTITLKFKDPETGEIKQIKKKVDKKIYDKLLVQEVEKRKDVINLLNFYKNKDIIENYEIDLIIDYLNRKISKTRTELILPENYKEMNNLDLINQILENFINLN